MMMETTSAQTLGQRIDQHTILHTRDPLALRAQNAVCGVEDEGQDVQEVVLLYETIQYVCLTEVNITYYQEYNNKNKKKKN